MMYITSVVLLIMLIASLPTGVWYCIDSLKPNPRRAQDRELLGIIAAEKRMVIQLGSSTTDTLTRKHTL
ncbi:hypothetical protein [Streptomyces rochei]|uniref:hypothetical protein n=1 Tax=Streptomyces rochei TaxID=1928 RepID=UPI004038FD63